MGHAFDPSTQEAEAGGSTERGQDSQVFVEKLCLEKTKNNIKSGLEVPHRGRTYRVCLSGPGLHHVILSDYVHSD